MYLVFQRFVRPLDPTSSKPLYPYNIMTAEPSALGIIPARAQSSRFPLKVLAKINGKPMVQYVWEAATKAKRLSQVLIATDSEEVLCVIDGFGAKGVLTPGEFSSGTDRVAFVANDSDAPIVLSLQADEPLLSPESIDRLVDALSTDTSCGMATLAVLQNSPEALHDPNVVKVVVSPERRALYFSRQPLTSNTEGDFYKHVGIYAYRREVLSRFCSLKPSSLEKTERLEQLRALEHHIGMRVVVVTEDTIAVDVPSDIPKVENFLRHGPSSLRRV
jgi:3-deoxy-manno-octulosonate cytidylyltransferase (CMP-KDO synthetase)